MPFIHPSKQLGPKIPLSLVQIRGLLSGELDLRILDLGKPGTAENRSKQGQLKGRLHKQ